MSDSPPRRVRQLLETAAESFLILDILHIFSLTTVAVAYPLYSFLEANPAYFVTQRIQPGTILTLIAILSLALPVMLSLVPYLLQCLHNSTGALAKILVITFLFALGFAPLTRQIPGYFLGLLPDWTAFLFGIAIGLTLAYQYFTNKFLNLLLLLLTPMILIVPGGLLFDSDMRQILQSHAEYMSDVPPVTPQTTPPIIFIVFDELPALSLLDVEANIDPDRFPNFARLASQSTWYSQATTVHDYTLKAVPAILTGRLPMTGPVLPLLPNHPTSLFHLLSDSYSLNTRELLTHLNPNSAQDEATTASLLSFTTDLAAMYAHTVLPENTAQAWFPMDDNLWGGFFVQQGNGPREMPAGLHRWLEDQLGAEHEGDQVAQFRAFLETITAEPATLHFMHVNLPHRPFVYLPSGRLYNATDWINAGLESGTRPLYRHQLHHAHLLQSGLADRLLGELLDTLQDRGIFDQSLIVIVADHGMSFRDIANDRQANIENFPDIAYVPLLIKYPNQSEARVDDTNVHTIDIVPTILDALDCEATPRLDGRSLLDADAPRPDAKFIMNRIDDVFRVSVDDARGQFHEARQSLIQDFYLENPATTLYQYGPRLDALGKPESEYSDRALNAQISFNNIAALESPATVATLNALVTGSVTLNEPGAGENLQIVIALNGTIVAQTPLHKIGDALLFHTVVPEDAIRPDRNTVSAHVLPDTPLN